MKAMTPSEHAAIAATRPPGALDRLLRKRLFASLSTLTGGRLAIEDSLGSATLGQGEPVVRLTIRDMAFYRLVATQGSVGAGEAYGDGMWTCDDLVALVGLLVRNRDTLDGMESGLARVAGWVLKRWHAGNRNTHAGSRRNIAAHYDLGNDFFSLFLSPDLMYSSALWAGADDTLEEASRRKLDTICRKLELGPGDRVVEIGSGWGGFAIHAARHYGCHVTTATISREQHVMALARVRAAGLDDRVSVVLQDYRDLQGRYNKLVSIEMIEAIGAQYLETYFAKVADLLAPHGRALIQAITIEDHRYQQALGEVDFIKRHIFPGSFIPSIEAMLRAKTRASDLALVHLEDFGLSYARTLQAWRQRFLAHLPEVRDQGFDSRFCRLWEFYLAYCEGGFRERSIGVSHLLLTHPGARGSGERWVQAGV
ncbi:class I SAM-dependent methyltransferase [Achromobacter deleyi]|uniref:Class I SAM-dependent methyltransferase n=2 Tax=Achromobacter deleyi TaxID=1353891 RepID=A0A7T4E5W3_9BURK|nr:class I SAM-dependent methyltransferase [Achromobacter deleyi]